MQRKSEKRGSGKKWLPASLPIELEYLIKLGKL
jgi:hypothetical protein